jgi:hypothetical protein
MRGLGAHGEAKDWMPSGLEESVEFRFSRFAPGLVGATNSDDVLAQPAVAMLQKKGQLDTKMPAGHAYLGQSPITT